MVDDKTPLDQAIELGLYAPLGLALEARNLLPTLVERGRAQVQMAKVLGRFAMQQGQIEAEKRLREIGLRPNPASPADRPTPGSPPDATSVVAPIRAGAEAGDLAIADYDSLAASQVIPRLGGLDTEELDAVRTYEIDHRGRKTILGKIAQLSGE